MSQPNTDSSVPNGMPPYKWDGSKYPLNNGLSSSQSSSRGSSPVSRFGNVPISQLPPSRTPIPTSQLPPSFKSANATPENSPYIPTYTSTPKTDAAANNSTGNHSDNTHQNGTTTPRHLGNLLTNQERDDIKQPMFVPISLPPEPKDPPPSLKPSLTEQVTLTKTSAVPFTQLHTQKTGYASAFAPVAKTSEPPIPGQSPGTFGKPQTNFGQPPSLINSNTNQPPQLFPNQNATLRPQATIQNQPRPPPTTQEMFSNQITIPQPQIPPLNNQTSPSNNQLTTSKHQGMTQMPPIIQSVPFGNQTTTSVSQGPTQNQSLPSLNQAPVTHVPPMSTNVGKPPTNIGQVPPVTNQTTVTRQTLLDSTQKPPENTQAMQRQQLFNPQINQVASQSMQAPLTTSQTHSTSHGMEKQQFGGSSDVFPPPGLGPISQVRPTTSQGAAITSQVHSMSQGIQNQQFGLNPQVFTPPGGPSIISQSHSTSQGMKNQQFGVSPQLFAAPGAGPTSQAPPIISQSHFTSQGMQNQPFGVGAPLFAPPGAGPTTSQGPAVTQGMQNQLFMPQSVSQTSQASLGVNQGPRGPQPMSQGPAMNQGVQNQQFGVRSQLYTPQGMNQSSQINQEGVQAAPMSGQPSQAVPALIQPRTMNQGLASQTGQNQVFGAISTQNQQFGATAQKPGPFFNPQQQRSFGVPPTQTQPVREQSFGVMTSQNQEFGARQQNTQITTSVSGQTLPAVNQFLSPGNSPRTATLATDINTIQGSNFNNTPKSEYSSPQTYPSTPTSTVGGKRYPQPQTKYTSNAATYTSQYRSQTPNQMIQGMTNMNLQTSGFNRIWGAENFDLLQCPNVLPTEKLEAPRVCLGQEYLNNANCSTDIFRCTMTKIPDTSSLLQKSRLPLGVLIHPFKDLNHLPVIQCSTIVRCRACRTYINPFIFFVDTKRWKCNLCYRVNELPEEFQYDPVSKSYGDPSRRPEIKSSTIEYIAPSEYMLRPPQPAVYLFLLDISRLAIESGYLHTVCEVLSSHLPNLPGDSRTQIGLIAYNSTLHFFALGEGLSQPHEMTVLDIDDVFLPCPDNLLVNLKERIDLVQDLLTLLPTRYINSYDNGSALGAALQSAFKMMSATGGRVTVFQATLPTLGPGALTVREDPNQRAGKEAPHLNPATDFYKRLALECSGHQISVDLFLINSQYIDIASLSGISRFSGGCMHHFPLFKASKPVYAESLERCFKRYLSRKIGFEAVMRIRCTRGLAVHTFHGNFFVRSTDLLSLPNVNPDSGFGLQVSIEESLSDLQNVCFQAALLYTSSKGERRIRVHTLCLPVVNNLSEILNSADQQCIIGMLAKMAVDRSMQSSLSDARDAFINVAIDILQSYKTSLNMGESGSGLIASHSLKLLPLYILALLKHIAFRSGHSTRLDDRVFAMCDMKTLPLYQLIQQVYPDLYPVHNLTDEGGITDTDGLIIPQPPRLQLTARNIDSHGAYLLDCGQEILIFVCQNVSMTFLTHVLGVPNYNSISDQFHELPKVENPDNQRLHNFIGSLNDEKPYWASLHIIRENSPNRTLFLERLIEDRIESALSYNEFLQHIKTQVK